MKRGEVKQERVMANKPSKNKTFKELAEEVIRNAEVRGLAEWTIKTYRYHTRYFIDFAGDGLMCKDIGLDLLEDYILHMKKEKGLSNAVTTSKGYRQYKCY